MLAMFHFFKCTYHRFDYFIVIVCYSRFPEALRFPVLHFLSTFQVFVENGFLSSISKPYNYWHVSTITEKSILLPNSILRLLEKSNLKTALLSASAMRVTVVDLSYVWRWEKIRRNWRQNKKGFWCFSQFQQFSITWPKSCTYFVS